MDKRYNRSAMLYTIMFLAMLIFAVVSFFYGLNLGSKKTEEKYAAVIGISDKQPDYSYQQQDLVSFYLTVYAPYREFQLEWADTLNKISNGKVSNVSSIYKELEGQASKKAEAATSFSLQHAGKLGNAQQNYIRSLNSFEKVSNTLQKKSSSITYDEINALLNSSEEYSNAIKQALTGQELYFNVMYLWAISVDPNIPIQFKNNVSLNTDTWSSYPLIIKNEIIANYLLEQNKFEEFLPHDLTSAIDQFIESGQAKNMNISTVEGIISLLINTGAVRTGDYSLNKNKLYQDEFLPQIPFFYPDVE